MSTVTATMTPVSNLRRIKAINRKGITPAKLGTPPEMKVIKVHKLRVNDDYQRQMSDRGMRLIRSIIETWDWTKYHPPIVVQITPDTGLDDDTYEVLDGQHTSTAAASHGGIHQLMCLVVEAGTLIEKAEAFVGLNKNKVQISSIQTFWASVTAKHEDALEVVRGAQLAGAQVIKRPPPYGDFEVGECSCPTTLLNLAKRGGYIYVRRVLEAGVRSGLAPIGKDWITAFDHLFLRKGNLKIQGDYNDILTRVSQFIRSKETHEHLDEADRLRRVDGESRGKALAYIIKRGINVINE